MVNPFIEQDLLSLVGPRSRRKSVLWILNWIPSHGSEPHWQELKPLKTCRHRLGGRAMSAGILATVPDSGAMAAAAWDRAAAAALAVKDKYQTSWTDISKVYPHLTVHVFFLLQIDHAKFCLWLMLLIGFPLMHFFFGCIKLRVSFIHIYRWILKAFGNVNSTSK